MSRYVDITILSLPLKFTTSSSKYRATKIQEVLGLEQSINFASVSVINIVIIIIIMNIIMRVSGIIVVNINSKNVFPIKRNVFMI